MKASAICVWCGTQFTARTTGGSPQRFCSPADRAAFHSAARRWAERAVASGALSVPDIQSTAPAACTLPGTAEAVAPVPHQVGSITVALDVPAEAVGMLQGAGWLSARSVEGVADAIVDLVDCALACGRPPTRRI